MTVSRILCLIAVIVFAVAAFGVTFASVGAIELVAAGLAFFAASFLVP